MGDILTSWGSTEVGVGAVITDLYAKLVARFGLRCITAAPMRLPRKHEMHLGFRVPAPVVLGQSGKDVKFGHFSHATYLTQGHNGKKVNVLQL